MFLVFEYHDGGSSPSDNLKGNIYIAICYAAFTPFRTCVCNPQRM